jgi:hypothetical protein
MQHWHAQAELKPFAYQPRQKLYRMGRLPARCHLDLIFGEIYLKQRQLSHAFAYAWRAQAREEYRRQLL